MELEEIVFLKWCGIKVMDLMQWMKRNFLPMCFMAYTVFWLIFFPGSFKWNCFVFMDWIPQHVFWSSSLLAFVSYIATTGYIWYKESRTNKGSIKRKPVFWFKPELLFYRYAHNNLITAGLALFIVSALFSFTIPATLLILENAGYWNYRGNGNTSTFPESVLYDEGIIFVFFVSLIAIWTFLNTDILKARIEKPISDLGDLFNAINGILKQVLDEIVKNKGRTGHACPISFIYILDHSIATAHYSIEIEKTRKKELYQEYRQLLRDLRKECDIMVRAVVYNKNILREEYIRDFGNDDIKNANLKNWDIWLVDSRDVIVDKFLNVGAEDKITYNPMRENDETIYDIHNNEIEIIWSRTHNEEINLYNNVKNELTNLDPGKKSIILDTDEIGPFRFIVTDLFAVQFGARVKKDGFGRNVPIGYFTQDLNMIEKYKNIFEYYFERQLSKS